MPAKAFFDTNVLIYAFAADNPKGAKAEALLAAGGTTSVQAFNEFTNVSRRKLNLDWPDIEARIAVLKVLLGDPAPLTLATHDTARILAQAHGLSFYDALIVASAQEARAETLFSEDMQADRRIGDLVIRNPFA